MAARGARGDPKLAAVVWERQNLVTEWQKLELLRNAALGQETAKRDAKAEAESVARLATIDTRIAEIDKWLAAEFPEYAALASPAPLPIEEAQTQLGADEALVLFLEIGHYHHLSGAYLDRYAREAAFREDHRRTANGEQFGTVVGLVAKNGPSVDFCGYWQRARAA